MSKTTKHEMTAIIEVDETNEKIRSVGFTCDTALIPLRSSTILTVIETWLMPWSSKESYIERCDCPSCAAMNTALDEMAAIYLKCRSQFEVPHVKH